jgi:two-component system sensor histidine kinase UhpB
MAPGAGDSWNEEFRALHPAKGWRWMSGVGRVDRDAGGRAVRFAGINLDITERKCAEESVRNSERRLRAFMENSAVIAWTKDEDGRHLFLSENYQKRFHVRLEDWLGKTDFDVWPREIAEEFRRNDMAVLAGDKHVEVIERARTPDGRESWWLNSKFVYRDDSGRRCIGGLGVDITARKLAEDEIVRLNEVLEQRVQERTAQCQTVVSDLRASDERLRMTAQAGNVGLWDLDLATRRVFYSPEWKRQIGYEEHEIGDDLAEWRSRVHPDDLEPVLRLLRPDEANARPRYEYEFRFRHKDGSYRWILARASFVVDADGKHRRLMGSHVDITERKRVEQDLLQRSRQLAALASELTMTEHRERRLLAGRLHDELQQQLVAARMQVELLQRRDASPHLQRLHEVLTDAMNSARRITQELAPPALLRKDLGESIRWLIDDMHKRHELSIEIEAASLGKVPEAVSVLVHSAVRELLLNVVKHAGTRAARVCVVRDGHVLTLEVSDAGVGFVPEAMHADHAGGGFGLFSLRERTEWLGGKLAIDTAPGRGARIRLTLPLRPEKASQRPGKRRAPSGAGASLRDSA